MRKKNALYNISSNLILQFVIILYGFIAPKIIINLFGSSVNGLISSITQFLAYISLLESGFGPVVKSLLYKPITENNKETIENILKTADNFFKKIALVFIVYIIFLCLLFPIIIAKEFNSLFTISLIIILSISQFAEYFFGITYKIFLEAKQKNYIINIVQILTYFINIFLIIILANFNVSIQFLKLFTGLIFVLRPLILNFYVRKKFNIKFDKNSPKINIQQKWDGLAQHIASVVHGSTDITILSLFCNLTEVSVYSVYSLVVKGVKAIIQSFNNGMDAMFGNMLANGEKENLQQKFNIYEIFYFTITTIIFTCTLILIIPFISIYTNNVKDANYIRPLFSILIVLSEYVCMIRLPYISLTYAAGHFRETKNGAILEALINILLSLILVRKYGINGAAIGTLIAMLFRTLEFLYHANKYILNRNIWHSLKKTIIVIFETLIILYSSNMLFMNYDVNTYLSWTILAIKVSIFSSIIVVLTNIIVYRKELKNINYKIKEETK